MSSSYSYDQELLTADESNMETTKLMQNNQSDLNTLDSKTNTDTKSLKLETDNQQCEVKNGDLKKPENIEMSTSTHSVKCCSGFLSKHKNKKMKVVKETQTNGTSNGKCYFNSFKEKLANGKNHVDNKCDASEGNMMKKSVIFDDRDPFKINSHVKFEFSNVYAEPNTGTYSFNPVWGSMNKMYFCVKLNLYRLLSILIGFPSAILFAVLFSVVSALQIWLVGPLMRLFKCLFSIFRELWCTILDAVFGPFFQLFFSYRMHNSNSSSCPSTASSKSIYNEDANIV